MTQCFKQNRSTLFRGLIYLSVVCSVCVNSVQAQTRKQSASIGWGVAIPPGDAYIDKTSAVNASLEWNYRVLPAFSAGLSLGYGNSSVKGVADERFNSALISGYREKKLNTMPVIVRFDYFPLGDAGTLFRPYVGVGAGVQYAKFRITGDSIVTSTANSWAESFSARIGTQICPQREGKLFFDARCTWQYSGNSWSAAEIESIQSIGIMIGAGILF